MEAELDHTFFTITTWDGNPGQISLPTIHVWNFTVASNFEDCNGDIQGVIQHINLQLPNVQGYTYSTTANHRFYVAASPNPYETEIENYERLIHYEPPEPGALQTKDTDSFTYGQQIAAPVSSRTMVSGTVMAYGSILGTDVEYLDIPISGTRCCQ